MIKIDPYLNFTDCTEEAFNFYKSVFGGELKIVRFKDMPGNAGASDADKEKIMHASLKIGENDFMSSDAPETMGYKINKGNNFYLSITVDNEEEARRIFGALSNNGKIEMPLSKMEWSPLWGALKDKYGIQWMVSLVQK